MHRQRLLWLFATLLLQKPAVAENTWIYPDPNSTAVFNYVDVVNATWTSDFINPNLLLWCQEQTTGQAAPWRVDYNKTVPSSGSRSVTLDFGSAQGCHFELHQYEVENKGLNSGTIIIEVRKDKDPVIWSQDSQQSALNTSGTALPAASSTISSGAAATSSVAPVAATTSAASTAKSGLSSGAKAGIGVGVSVGVLAIGTVVAFLMLRRRRSQNQRKVGEGNYEGSPAHYQSVDATRVPQQELPVNPAEMEGKQPSHELPATRQ